MALLEFERFQLQASSCFLRRYLERILDNLLQICSLYCANFLAKWGRRVRRVPLQFGLRFRWQNTALL